MTPSGQAIRQRWETASSQWHHQVRLSGNGERQRAVNDTIRSGSPATVRDSEQSMTPSGQAIQQRWETASSQWHHQVRLSSNGERQRAVNDTIRSGYPATVRDSEQSMTPSGQAIRQRWEKASSQWHHQVRLSSNGERQRAVNGTIRSGYPATVRDSEQSMTPSGQAIQQRWETASSQWHHQVRLSSNGERQRAVNDTIRSGYPATVRDSEQSMTPSGQAIQQRWETASSQWHHQVRLSSNGERQRAVNDTIRSGYPAKVRDSEQSMTPSGQAIQQRWETASSQWHHQVRLSSNGERQRAVNDTIRSGYPATVRDSEQSMTPSGQAIQQGRARSRHASTSLSLPLAECRVIWTVRDSEQSMAPSGQAIQQGRARSRHASTSLSLPLAECRVIWTVRDSEQSMTPSGQAILQQGRARSRHASLNITIITVSRM